jgi:hypothetical protein
MRKIATKISKKLRKSQSKKIINLSEFKKSKQVLSQEFQTLQSTDSLIKKGHNIQHAIYISAQNILSLLIGILSELRELDKLNKILDTSQDMYTPSWPPMSPISNSSFFSWSAFDIRVGIDKESYTSCIIDNRHNLGLNDDICHLITLMDASRLGIYKVVDFAEDKWLLEDIFTQKQYHCVGPDNYPFNAGELWLVRLLPPISEQFDSHVIFTSPYILLEKENEWLAFLNRNIKCIRPSPTSEKFYKQFMKHGLSHYYWLEFMMQGYSNHTDLTINLAGIPDIETSRPHPFDNQILTERL